MKKITLLSALLLFSIPAYAGMKEHFEEAMLDCMSWQNELICRKAEGAARNYADNIRAEDPNCGSVVTALMTTTVVVPYGGLGMATGMWKNYEK